MWLLKTNKPVTKSQETQNTIHLIGCAGEGTFKGVSRRSVPSHRKWHQRANSQVKSFIGIAWRCQLRASFQIQERVRETISLRIFLLCETVIQPYPLVKMYAHFNSIVTDESRLRIPTVISLPSNKVRRGGLRWQVIDVLTNTGDEFPNNKTTYTQAHKKWIKLG